MPTFDEIRDQINTDLPDNTTGLISPEDLRETLLAIVDKLEQVGVPAGGTTGQVLTKSSNANYDVEWEEGGNLPQLNAPGLTVTAGDSQLSVAISADSNATSTTVEASDDDFATIAGSQTGSGATLVITGLANGVAYKVRGFSEAAGYSDSDYTTASGTYTPSGVTTFTIKVGYSATDPYVDDLTAPTFTTAHTTTQPTGEDILADLHDHPSLNFSVIEYDETEPDATTWYDTSFNNGTIPDFAQRAIFAPGNGKKYIVSRSAISYDTTVGHTVTFGH